MIYQGNAKYPVHELCFHTSATTKSWMLNKTTHQKVAEIRRWHVEERGWSDIGYHLIIDTDGTITPGRAFSRIGAGVAGHNRGVIHVCLIGGHGGASTDRFRDHYSLLQFTSAMYVIADVGMKTDLKLLSGHNDYANKGCPCFKVTPWYNRLRQYGYDA